jgi:ApaG protein
MAETPRHEITVVTKSAYLADQSDPAKNQYVFSYTIKVTNTGDVSAQIVGRHW